MGDEVAKFGEAVRVFSEDISQDAWQSEDPVAMRDGEAHLVPDEDGCIEGASLMVTWAAASPLTGEGEKIVVTAVWAVGAKKPLARSPQRRLS